MHVAHQLAGRGDHLSGWMALVEGVRRAVQEADPVLVQTADEIHGLDAVLDEVVGMRLDDQLQSFTLEDRQQLVHRSQELGLGRLGGFGSSVELGVDDLHAEIDGDLDDPLPGPYGGLPLILVRAGPAQHRQHRGETHAGVGGHLLEFADAGVVDPGIAEERDEVGLGRQLHPVVTEAGHDVGQFVHRAGGEEHLRIEGEFHDSPPGRG